MAVPRKRRQHAEEQHAEQPRRIPDHRPSKRDQGDCALKKRPHGRENRHTIRRLYAGSLQLVIEARVFEVRKVKYCRLLHDLQADVVGKLIGQPGVHVIHRAPENQAPGGKSEFGPEQGPELRCLVNMAAVFGVDQVNDEARYRQDAERYQRRQRSQPDYAAHQAGCHTPQQLHHTGQVLECRDPLLPEVGGLRAPALPRVAHEPDLQNVKGGASRRVKTLAMQADGQNRTGPISSVRNPTFPLLRPRVTLSRD